jgi:hypothetical protein
MIMQQTESLSVARDLMTEFAEQTGLSSHRPPRRYLWTDAFAVCNLLELFRQTGEGQWRDLALRLVEQVHAVLGRHRDDDPRSGWISGLDEREGRLHPTAGGLRIGKALNERREDEPFDDLLEWERDGQYFHYLTKWMHALNRVSAAIDDPLYNQWGVELAKAAYARFACVARDGGVKRLYWKMSIDLSRPLVPSMGQHDPLDGLVTFSQLRACAREAGEEGQAAGLGAPIEELAAICAGQDLLTNDALGIGGLLFDACRMTHLHLRDGFERFALLERTLEAAWLGLEALATRGPLRLPAEYRLAFRELGLAIGLRGVEKIRKLVEENPGAFDQGRLARLEPLGRYLPLAEQIERFWKAGESRQAASWQEHRAINRVMLATSLAPEGFLTV